MEESQLFNVFLEFRSLRMEFREVLSLEHKELTLASQLFQEFALICAVKTFFLILTLGKMTKKIRIKFFNRESKYFFSGLFSSSSFSSAFDWNVSNIPQSDRYQRHNCDSNVQNHIRIFCWFSELDYLKHRVKSPWMHYCYLCSFKRKTGKVKVFVACWRFFQKKL